MTTQAQPSPNTLFLITKSAFEILRAQLDYTDELIKRSGFTDDFAVKLTVAANQFIAHRQSTGYDTVLAGLPWFTDWGRDTMIHTPA